MIFALLLPSALLEQFTLSIVSPSRLGIVANAVLPLVVAEAVSARRLYQRNK
jgi:hypothetical protein